MLIPAAAAPEPHPKGSFPSSFSALFVFCTKSRRAERYWQKTLLQMEEMESQIREEIRKGEAPSWAPGRS